MESNINFFQMTWNRAFCDLEILAKIAGWEFSALTCGRKNIRALPRWCACTSWWGRRWVSWGAPSLDRETCGVSWPAWRECPRGSPAEPRRQPRHPRHRPRRIPRRAWAPRPLGARKGAHRRCPSSRSLKASRDKRINACEERRVLTLMHIVRKFSDTISIGATSLPELPD